MTFLPLRRAHAPVAAAVGALALLAASGPTTAPHPLVADAGAVSEVHPVAARSHPATATPVEHLVIIYQENVSFDHYFATYPQAENTAGEPSFRPAPGTPSVNGLGVSLQSPNNPNSVQPFWNTGRVGNFSFDEKAGSLTNLFTFRTHGDDGHGAHAPRLTLDPETGQPKAL